MSGVKFEMSWQWDENKAEQKKWRKTTIIPKRIECWATWCLYHFGAYVVFHCPDLYTFCLYHLKIVCLFCLFGLKNSLMCICSICSRGFKEILNRTLFSISSRKFNIRNIIYTTFTSLSTICSCLRDAKNGHVTFSFSHG